MSEPKRLASGRGGPRNLRAGIAAANLARDAALRETAAALVAEGEWPSPAAVAERSGIPEETVKRHRPALLEMRRRWVLKNGPHSHWRDPGAAAVPPPEAATEVSDRRVARLEAQLERALRSLEEEKRARRREKEASLRIAEENRRLLVTVRARYGG